GADALRTDSGHDMPHRAVFARRVHALQDHQEFVLVLREEQLLKVGQFSAQLVALGVRFLFVAGREARAVRSEIAEIDLGSKLEAQLRHYGDGCYNASMSSRRRRWGT